MNELNKLEQKLWISIYEREFDFIRNKAVTDFENPRRRADKAVDEFRNKFNKP